MSRGLYYCHLTVSKFLNRFFFFSECMNNHVSSLFNELCFKKYVYLINSNRLPVLKFKKIGIIFRFINLTHGSNYAHEIWHNICMTLCTISGQDDSSLIGSFHLSSTLSIFKTLIQKLNRLLFLLIDDVNLIKYGRTLSILEKPFRKYLPNLVLITTSTLNTPIPFMPIPILYEIPEITSNDILNYVREFAIAVERKFNDDQIAVIKANV